MDAIYNVTFGEKDYTVVADSLLLAIERAKTRAKKDKVRGSVTSAYLSTSGDNIVWGT